MAARAWRFEAIYPKYDGLVRATLRRYGVRSADLDDVTQEAFVTIHRKLAEFEERSSIETWLHAMCWRIAVAYRRRAHIQRETALQGEGSDDEEQPESAKLLLANRLHASLGGLTEEQRDLLALHEIGGLSISELAALTGVTRETVRHRLERARAALRSAIELPEGERGVATGEPGAALGSYTETTFTGDSFEYFDSAAAISSRGPHVYVVWRKASKVAHLQLLADLMRSLVDRYPGQITYLCIIEDTSKPPDAACRQLNSEILALLGPDLRAAAFITQRKILSALLPPVMNTAAFFARGEFPMRYFSSVARGSAYVAARCGIPVAPLIAELDRLREQLDALTDSTG